MKNRDLKKYLPFGGVQYFREQRRQFTSLVSQLDEDETFEWHRKFQKLNAKHTGYSMLSVFPGLVYSVFALDPVPLILNMVASLSYDTLIHGRQLEKWNEDIRNIFGVQ